MSRLYIYIYIYLMITISMNQIAAVQISSVKKILNDFKAENYFPSLILSHKMFNIDDAMGLMIITLNGIPA